MFPNQDAQLSDTSNLKNAVASNSRSKTGISALFHLLNFHPSHQVKIGDTWSKTFFKLYLDEQIDYEFTLKEENDSLYLIDINRTVSSKGTLSAPVDFITGTIQMKQEIVGTEKGYIKVDKKTGWVTRLFINRSILGYVTMYDAENKNDDGTIIPMEVQKNIYIEKMLR
jgi:hypothetical protein